MPGIEWANDRILRPGPATLPELSAILSQAHASLGPGKQVTGLVSQGAIAAVHAHLRADVSREHGGVLVGRPYHDPATGKHITVVHAAVPAQDAFGSSAYFQFTPEAWAHISSVIDRSYRDYVIVGWYHSHPGLGVFMSGTDRASQRAFYHHPWSVALVYDPVRDQRGWFVGATCEPLLLDEVVFFTEPLLRQPETHAELAELPVPKSTADSVQPTVDDNRLWVLVPVLIGGIVICSIYLMRRKKR